MAGITVIMMNMETLLLAILAALLGANKKQ
jgi:hypothetical protein